MQELFVGFFSVRNGYLGADGVVAPCFSTDFSHIANN